MKTRIILMFIILFAITTVEAQELTVKEILNKVEKNEKISSAKSTAKQTMITSKGKKRTLTMESYAKDFNDKQLSIYTAPARVKGDKILMLNGGDDIWFYTPKTDRVRHLVSNARKQKVQGSDISYQDMEQRDYNKDFNSKILGIEKINGINCYKIEAIPTETGPDYSKLIFFVDKTKFIILKAEFYEDGDLLKTLLSSDVAKIGNYWIAKKMVMTNNQTGSKTIFEIIDTEMDVEIDDYKFTTNYLKRK
ncbi:MAG: outer membrane lipoprotein-sorting protein [Bacteroidales bacterium]|nr:outer membrane lipoprotein-sorting protein [Bacteroidales bacterium]